MKVAIIIPARFASTRLPGKPLQMIGDKPMILHVANQAKKVKGVNEVWIATDHQEIFDVVRSAGFNAVMTSENHQTGTDRIAEANKTVNADIVINIQGDEPFINPETIEMALIPVKNDVSVHISTLATGFNSDIEIQNPNYVKIVTDVHQKALYFSRSVIPFPRDQKENIHSNYPYLRHIGLYVYRKDVLDNLASLEAVRLETTEKLEQLRALYYGYSIAIVRVDEVALSVDTPEDLEKARAYHAAN